MLLSERTLKIRRFLLILSVISLAHVFYDIIPPTYSGIKIPVDIPISLLLLVVVMYITSYFILYCRRDRHLLMKDSISGRIELFHRSRRTNDELLRDAITTGKAGPNLDKEVMKIIDEQSKRLNEGISSLEKEFVRWQSQSVFLWRVNFHFEISIPIAVACLTSVILILSMIGIFDDNT